MRHITVPATITRLTRGIMYAALLGSGVSFEVAPSPVLIEQLGWKAYVWAAFLILGGLLGLAGAVVDRWPPEFIACPISATATLTYAVGNLLSHVPWRVSLALLLLAASAAITSRFLALYELLWTDKDRRDKLRHDDRAKM